MHSKPSKNNKLKEMANQLNAFIVTPRNPIFAGTVKFDSTLKDKVPSQYKTEYAKNRKIKMSQVELAKADSF